jgi:hypothetical protein
MGRTNPEDYFGSSHWQLAIALLLKQHLICIFLLVCEDEITLLKA